MAFYIFIIGLLIGSFANVVIYRLPRGEKFGISRSHCPKCNKNLVWYDLIPLFSFFWLKARCRFCQTKISVIYPAVELVSGLLFLISFWLYKYNFLTFNSGSITQWLFYVFILESLLVLAVIDAKHLILPDKVILTMIVGTVLFGLAAKLDYVPNVHQPLSKANLMTAVAFFATFFLLWFFSKGKALGLGDAKLAGFIGLVLGFWNALIVIYIAVTLGAGYGLFLLISKKANLKSKLPLGTFISISAILYLLGGLQFIQNSNIFRLIYLARF